MRSWWGSLSWRAHACLSVIGGVLAGLALTDLADRLPDWAFAGLLGVFVAGVALWTLRQAGLMRRHRQLWDTFAREVAAAGGYQHLSEQRRRYWLDTMEGQTAALRGRTRRDGTAG